jgi:hypothetical protein
LADENKSIGAFVYSRSDALRRLAELAPVREKRMVNLWRYDAASISTWEDATAANDSARIAGGWRKVGGPFEIED